MIPLKSDEENSQFLDFIYAISQINNQDSDFTKIKKIDVEKDKKELRDQLRYSSKQTFKLYFKSMDIFLNEKIEKVH